jgi:hypothetical protein
MAGGPSGGTTMAAASATPTRRAHAAQERVGASPQRASRRLQDHSQDMTPLLGCAVAHPEEAPRHDWEGVRCPVDQDQEPSILGRRQRTVLGGHRAAGGARLPLAAPLRQMGLESGLKRRDQASKLVPGETGQLQPLHGAGLVRGHLWCARYLVNSTAEREFMQFPREAFELLLMGVPLVA